MPVNPNLLALRRAEAAPPGVQKPSRAEVEAAVRSIIQWAPGTDLVTSRMLGCFRDNLLTRQEFLGVAT